MTLPSLDAVEAALLDRLRVVQPVLDPGDYEGLGVTGYLHRLALSVKRLPESRRAWLLFVAVAGAFPTDSEVSDLLRQLALSADGAVLVPLLSSTVDAASRPWAWAQSIELVEDAVVVDVNFCATHEHNTGIQRVVRELMPRWVEAELPVRLVAWSSTPIGMRDLDDIERDRVLRWNSRRRPEPVPPGEHDPTRHMVVPWNCRVLMPEVPLDFICPRAAALARWSGNSVTLIGYDAIPLVSAESQLPAESERFARYLGVVKYAERVVAISESAAEEFRGFVDALAAQGIDGPEVVAVPLAVEVSEAALVAPRAAPADRPLVLCVGSHEPRKNQDAVLVAGEALHRRGLDFELVFVGGGNRTATVRFDRRVKQLRRAGFEVRALRGISDAELWALFARARFSVFVSLHEGFGLPVAESLALGVPVLTSDFGSLAEIAAMGGCESVDPRDDDAIESGMHRMLTDDVLIGRLRGEAAAIPERTWAQYAGELWEAARLRGRVVS